MDSLNEHERILALSRFLDLWANEHLRGEPDWRPLELVAPPEWCSGFMWMQRVNEDGIVIELYKHGLTRRYLNLDQLGGAYRFTGGGYVPIEVDQAIEWVLEGIVETGSTRETAYDDDFVERKQQERRWA